MKKFPEFAVRCMLPSDATAAAASPFTALGPLRTHKRDATGLQVVNRCRVTIGAAARFAT
jgi:hypothetical protein